MHFSTDLVGRARARAAAVRRRRHAADLLRRRRPVGGPRGRRRDAAVRRHALVMKSTVPVGTGRDIKRVFAEQGKDGFRYVSLPGVPQGGLGGQGLPGARPGRDRRRRRLGRRRGRRPVRAAADAEHGGRLELVRTDITSAEMVKLASNAFLATKISFINEIANVCEETGADVSRSPRAWAWTTASARSSCRPGIGFGGSCFPKDVTALKQLAGNSGYHFQLLNAVIEVNELQKRRVIAKLQKHLGSLVGKKIALLGLAFKPNTDDMREASSLVLSRAAAGRWRARARVRPGRRGGGAQAHPRRRSSPPARSRRRRAPTPSCSSPSGSEFAELDWAQVAGAMAGTLLVDGRNLLDPAAVRAAGPDLRRHRPRDRWHPSRGDRRSRGRRAGTDPRRRRGHAAAAADLDRPEAGRPARRPAVHRVHARLAAPPRRRRRDHVVRLPGRRRAQRARRRLGRTGSGCATSRSPSRSAPAAR